MSVLDGVVEGLKAVSAKLSQPGFKPDRTRRDWNRDEVDALLRDFTDAVLTPFDAALAELSDDEHRKFKDIVGRLSGSVAAVLGASGRNDEAKALLQRASELSASAVARARLSAAVGQLDWHVELALAEWHSRADDVKAARAVLERIVKHAPPGMIRDEASEAVQVNEEELEPVGSPPSMFTLNGVGTRLYGRADQRPDGSYVSTLCFCVLFIPVLPLTSYRVVDAEGGGYYFLGKVKKLRRGWTLWRNFLLAAVVLGIAGSAISEELTSPRRLARNALEHALDAEKAGKPEVAAQELDALIDQYRSQVSNDELTPALEAWLRLELAKLEQPLTLAQVDRLVRVTRRVEDLSSSGNWAKDAAGPLIARLSEGATQLGTRTPEHTEASLRLLSAAAKIAPAKSQDALATQVRALHVEVARGLADWPLWALEHYVLALPAPEALAGADAVLRAVGNSPEVLAENAAEIALWQTTTKDQALAASVKGWLQTGVTMEKLPEREKLLSSGQLATLRKALAADPTDQGVAVAVALELRDANQLEAALATLTALGAPGVLTQDALALRASLLLSLGRRDEGRKLLEAAVERSLPKLQRAREQFDLTASGAEQRLIARAKNNDLPLSLQQQLEKADETKGRELFGAWLTEELEKDPQVQEARERYGRLAGVAGLSVMLGSIELQEGSAATGDARDQLLRRAEHHFVAVQAEREGSASYRLGYGQVLHRLGRAKEGDELLQAVLDTGSADQKLDAAFAYRELGLVQRSKQALEHLWNTEPQPTKDRAASAMAAMADRIEDDELWLSRIQTPTPVTRINLAHARARRLQRDGKLTEADAEFANVVAFHEKHAKTDAAAANNAAVALLERHACTGDVAYLDRAVEHFRSCRRLNPENGLLIAHMAEVLDDRAAVRLVESLVHVRPLRLAGRDAHALLSTLSHGPMAEELKKRMATEPLVRELKEVTATEQVLGPGRTEPIARLQRWARYEDDLPTLSALAQRAEAQHAAFDFSEELARDARSAAGTDTEQYSAALRAARGLLSSVVTDAHAPTRATALLQRCIYEQQLAFLTPNAEAAHESVTDCEAARAAWPAMSIDLARLHLGVALLELYPHSPALQAKWKSKLRVQDDTAFVSELLLDPAINVDLVKQPAFSLALKASNELPTESLGLSDWALAVAGHDEALITRVKTALSSERGVVSHRLSVAMSPPGEGLEARTALYARATK